MDSAAEAQSGPAPSEPALPPAAPSARAEAAPPPALGGVASGAGSAMGGGMQMEKKKSRAGLGTEYGETVNSSIYEVSFERATSNPCAVLGARYNDREGLIALGIDVDGVSEQSLRRTAEPFPVVERSFAQPPPGWSR